MPDELTLDPADWPAFTALAHRMVDDTLHHLRTLRERPAWTALPPDVRDRLRSEPLPLDGVGEEAAYEAFVRDVRPYPNGNLDPRFFGWVQGTGTPLGAMADMLASALNPHMAGFDQAPALVERQVTDWLRTLMGFPAGSTGLLVSGGSMASVTAMAVARQAMAGFDVAELGAAGGPPLVVYASTETHGWIDKAMVLLGLGRRALRRVAVRGDHTLDVDALRRAVHADRAAGLRPAVVVGTAGTVNIGATDDLHALADLCAAEDLWLHVDGAFGALAALSPELRPPGMDRADSLAFDLHKWMYLPFEVACVLVRDGDAHRATFAQRASYLAAFERGVIAGGLPFADLGVELTRSFKALKVWLSLKAHGVRYFTALIEQNVAQARWLADRVDAEPELERTAPVPLNIVCFRYRAAAERVDALNTELLLRLQETGVAVPSSTVIDGGLCLRVCIVNHRTRREDLEALVVGVLEIGRDLVLGVRQED